MARKMDPVIHFEMPATDARRAAKFYDRVFGWKTASLGPEAGDFVLAFTTESDEATRMPKVRGAINGGFYKKSSGTDGVRLTILVDDVREAMKKIEEAGGKIIGEPFELPDVGLFVSFTDSEGNVATINQDFQVKRLK
jgi:predicted enzyme related to lactoylglutathione lyase